MGDEQGQKHFDTWPSTAPGGGLVLLVVATIISVADHSIQWPFLLIGATLALARSHLVVDTTERWVERRVGILVPTFGFSRKPITQIVLEERVTSQKSAQRDYHVMVVGESGTSLSVARERLLSEGRRKAEELAKAAALPLLDLATGAGLRQVGTLDQSLRSRIHQLGWQAQPLGPAGRLRVQGDRVELPRVSVFTSLLYPIAIPAMLFVVFAGLAVAAAFGGTRGSLAAILIAAGPLAGLALILAAVLVIYRGGSFGFMRSR